MKIKELLADAKARFTGKRYGSNDIIILGRGYEEPSQSNRLPLAIQEELSIGTPVEYKEPTLEERYDMALKQGHPRDWKIPYRGCGFGYGHSVNHYYKAVQFDRKRKLKKRLPLIAGSAVIGSIAGFILWKASLEK